jgi:hypothetical protein
LVTWERKNNAPVLDSEKRSADICSRLEGKSRHRLA